MAPYRYNPDNAPDRHRQLPEGEYDCIVFDAWEKESRAGNEMLCLDLVTDDADRRKLGTFFLVYGTPYTDRNVADLLDSLGIEATAELEVCPKLVVGKRGRVYCEHDGRFMKPKWFRSRETPRGADEPQPERRTPSGRTYTPPPPPKPAQAEAQDGDDDIPF